MYGNVVLCSDFYPCIKKLTGWAVSLSGFWLISHKLFCINGFCQLVYFENLPDLLKKVTLCSSCVGYLNTELTNAIYIEESEQSCLRILAEDFIVAVYVVLRNFVNMQESNFKENPMTNMEKCSKCKDHSFKFLKVGRESWYSRSTSAGDNTTNFEWGIVSDKVRVKSNYPNYPMCLEMS